MYDSVKDKNCAPIAVWKFLADLSNNLVSLSELLYILSS